MGAELGGRPPGVPPPVDPAALPTPASVATMPYTVNNTFTQQTGPVEQLAACQQEVAGSTHNVEAEPAAQRRLRIRQAHEFATGRDQRIAVIDSGVQPHPRLFGRLIDGGDYIENRSGLFDCEGHGTAVAGLIAAAPDPATGFVGVAPAAQILSIRQASTFYSVPVRHLDTGREVRTPVAGDTVSMAQAVMRAVRLGATVINISEAACFPAERDQVNAPDLQAAVHYAVEHNVVVVVAAANTSRACQQNSPGAVTTISSPGWFNDDVLTVAATDDNGEAADFSIRGPWVDVAAPGTGAVSLAAGRPGLTTEFIDAHGELRMLDGTGFATPYVAGLAALVRDRFRHLTARQVMHRIEQTAQHTAGLGGRSEELGYGMVDPVAALTAVLPEEQNLGSEPVRPSKLDGLGPPPPGNTLARTVALAGSAAALGLLVLTLVITHTIKRHRRHRTHDHVRRG
ncbi:MAG: type VII secretion-associated serine protease mycosin [Actinomycetota bacterium]|nr:type VII secretion-associated serine protease mycosin [Actinomycetota bacterium]